jgi:hypothetical protein
VFGDVIQRRKTKDVSKRSQMALKQPAVLALPKSFLRVSELNLFVDVDDQIERNTLT